MKITLNQAYSFYQQGQRDYQEDARWPEADQPPKTQRFFIVCDGVGGCDKGEVASKTVCVAMADAMRNVDLSGNFTPSDLSWVIDKAYEALNEAADDTDSDMATTMVMVCFHKGGCTMAHIGDSRIYQFRPNEGIIYRSNDHSLVNSLVHHGDLTPEAAIDHPRGNVITRCMSPDSEEGDRWETMMVTTTDIKAGDIFILCTDGVQKCVSDERLTAILESDATDEEKLRQIAVESVPSSDNNTCILIPVKDVAGMLEETGNDTRDSVITRQISHPPFKSIEIESVKKTKEKGFFKKLKDLLNL